MPPNSSLQPKPKPGVKGKGPLGISKWGWIAGAAIGILLGYMLLRKSSGGGSTAADSTGTAAPSSGTPTDGGSGGGSASASPDPTLSALGLTGGGTGTIGTPTTDTSSSAEAATVASTQPGPESSPMTVGALSGFPTGAFSISGGLDPAIATAVAAQNNMAAVNSNKEWQTKQYAATQPGQTPTAGF